MLKPYSVKYTITEDELICRDIEEVIRVPLKNIEKMEFDKLSLMEIQLMYNSRFRNSFLVAHAPRKKPRIHLGRDFYGILGGTRDGIMIHTSGEIVYGNKLFVAQRILKNLWK